MVPIILNRLFWPQDCVSIQQTTSEINSSRTKLGMLPDVSHHLLPVAHQSTLPQSTCQRTNSRLYEDDQSHDGSMTYDVWAIVVERLPEQPTGWDAS